MNEIAFIVGMLLLVMVALCGIRWEIEWAAERWYDERRGIGVHVNKPWYVRRYDKWQAKKSGRR